VKVKRAYITKDANGNKTYHEGSVVTRNAYDGQNRRVSRIVKNCGDLDYSYAYYYDGQRSLGEFTLQNFVQLKAYIWGLQYVDELVQLLTWSYDFTPLWAMQDANYNVIGLVNESGRQVERYEYTPYGERTIYGRQYLLYDREEAADWPNDPLLTTVQLTSTKMNPVVSLPLILNDIGFQVRVPAASS